MTYHLDFTDKAKNDIEAHRKAGNKIILNKRLNHFNENSEHPFTDTVKPELLKHSLDDCWSRRNNRKHRLIYEITDDIILILSAKGHYS